MQKVEDLRDMLGRAMEAVLAGTISPAQGKAIADLAGHVVDSARVEIQLAVATDGDAKGSGFIPVDPTIMKRLPRNV